MFTNVIRSLVIHVSLRVAIAGHALAQGQDPIWSCQLVGHLDCPGAADGIVDVADYDSVGPYTGRAGVLESPEIQCAIDCLDGYPDPDYFEPIPGQEGMPWVPDPIPGGVLNFAGGIRHLIERPLQLPFATTGSLILRGNGATLYIAVAEHSYPAGGVISLPAFQRRAPPSSNACDVAAMADLAVNWVVEGFRFSSNCGITDAGCIHPPGREDPTSNVVYKGLELHGTTGLHVRQCSFESLHVGVELRHALNATVENTSFTRGVFRDVALVGPEECDRPGLATTTCWIPCESGQPQAIVAPMRKRPHSRGDNDGLKVHRTRHGGGTNQETAVFLDRAAAAWINDPSFEGGRYRNLVDYTHSEAHAITLFAPRTEYGGAELSPMYVVEAPGGVLQVDQHSRAASHQRLLDVSSSSDLLVEIAHLIPAWPSANDPAFMFAPGPRTNGNGFSFIDRPASTGDHTNSPRWSGIWRDASDWSQPGDAPERLVFDAPALMILPTGLPGMARRGQVWHDPTDLQHPLRFAVRDGQVRRVDFTP